MPGFDNSVMYADNVDFTGGHPVAGKVTADGELLIGSTASPYIKVATLTAGTNIGVANASGSITVSFSGVLPVGSGGTGATTLTDGGILLGSGTNEITATAQPTNGQLLIGSTSSDPVLGTLTAGEAIDVTLGAGSITIDCEDWSTTNKGVGTLATDDEAYLLASTTDALTPSNMGAVFAVEKQSGFQEWTGAGSYYTVTNTDFTLDRPGIGWIDTKKVTWLGAQTASSLTAGNAHYIYIDSSGIIGSTTTRSTSLFQDNIVLFEVLVDSDTPANVIVVRENHLLDTHPSTMNSLHKLGAHGYDVSVAQGGTVSLNGTLGVQVDGTTTWHDHDLEVTIPDSSSTAVDWNIMYTNGAGKWVLLATQNTLPTQYNNAGTPTALAGNERSIYELRVSKDDIESATPKYFAIMDDAAYANLALANAARIGKNYSTVTNELLQIETIRMGNVVINATAIDSVNVDKEFMGGGSITINNSTSASDVSLTTTNFDGWLSASDTTVQAAMETLDDIGKWEIITDASGTMVAFHNYIANRGTLVTLTLPATAVLGDTFKVINVGAGLVRIAQNASDQIRFGTTTTTSGVGGYIECTGLGDFVEIVAQAANTYLVIGRDGNWTII